MKEYIICNRFNPLEFIGNKKKISITKNIKNAKIFNDLDIAIKFIGNIPKTIRINKLWEVKELKSTQSSNDVPTKDINSIKSVHYTVPIQVNYDNNHNYNSDLECIFEIISDCEKELKILENEINILEQEIIDLQHYIEFNRFSASEGYCTCAKLQLVLLKRRKAKNDISKIKALKKIFNNNVSLEEIKTKFSQIDNQKYTPRVLLDLFN